MEEEYWKLLAGAIKIHTLYTPSRIFQHVIVKLRLTNHIRVGKHLGWTNGCY